MRSIFLFLCLSMTLFGTPSLFVPGALSYEYSVAPDEILQGSIPIQNDGDTPIKVKVTLTDYLFNSKGESFFPEAGSNARSNTSWIEAKKTFFEVAPHTTYTFSYTIHIPNQTNLEGTYWSIFLVEPVEEIAPDPKKKQSLGVQTVIRYGVQVLTHLTNKGSFDLKITDKKFVKEEGHFLLSVENLGSLSGSPQMSMELIDSSGKKVGRFEGAKQRILPSCSVSYKVDLSSISKGTYKALVLLDGGGNDLFGAHYNLTID